MRDPKAANPNPVDDPEKAPRHHDRPSHLERMTAIETEAVAGASKTLMHPGPALPNNGVEDPEPSPEPVETKPDLPESE